MKWVEFTAVALAVLLFFVAPERFWLTVQCACWALRPLAEFFIEFWNGITTVFQLSSLYLNLHWQGGFPRLVLSVYDCEPVKAIVAHSFSGSLCQH